MLTVVIQAGGESRRMGQDKGLMAFLGQPLIVRVISRLASVAAEMLITTNQPEAYRFLGLPLFPDRIPHRGALGGLYTALYAAAQPFVAVVACDMPFANPSLLVYQQSLLQSSTLDIAIPYTESGLEPFHAVYRRATCLPHIEAALAADQWRVDSWFNKVEVRRLSLAEMQPYDPSGLAFRNVNTPQELEEATQLAQRLEK